MMKPTTKDQFFKSLNESNFRSKSQIRDIMPSKTSITFEKGFSTTVWKCQKNPNFIFGKTISANGNTKYFLNNS